MDCEEYKEWKENLAKEGKMSLTPAQALKFGIKIPADSDGVIVEIDALKHINKA